MIGDEVLHMDGYGVTITDIIENEETSTVYNLNNVEKNNNFFVENLLAHNRFHWHHLRVLLQVLKFLYQMEIQKT